MARTNKYSSLNLNDVFEKKLTTNNHHPSSHNASSAKSFSTHSNTVLSKSRIHGHMLVLTRPTPKPISIPQSHNPDHKDNKGSAVPDQSNPIPEQGSISLRPQGRTGSAPPLISPPLPSPVSPLPSPAKSNRFVPPHLRPGFVGKEEKPGPELGKGGSGSFKGKPEVRVHRPGFDPIDRRPKSGGEHDPVSRGRDPADLNRPGSSGTRPSSSG